MNYILAIFVIAIIALQIYLFLKTGKLISKMKLVLSGNFTTRYLPDDGVSQIIYSATETDGISNSIEYSINTYLKKNKGAVSDFNLIKDIVERNCDSLEAEISSQTPLPLYLGLMGTVAGIVLGLLAITIGGGFQNIHKVIDVLMRDVAIAMIASFMGIGFTTWTLWKSKQCKAIVEFNKNKFYTWIQTNLLPVISKSAVSAITLLQQNLTRFNDSFGDTVERLEERLGNVGEIYSSQIKILEKIETIDVKRMATANVKVLAALDGSMGSLERFSRYMADVTEYLEAVRDLNDKLDEHLERTETLGVVSDFYKKQMREIELRQDAIKAAVLSVDDVMKSAFATLQANSEAGLRSVQEAFVAQMNAMQEMVSRQTESLTAHLTQMPKILSKLDEISNIPSRLDKLIDRIEKSNSEMAKSVARACNHGTTDSKGGNTVLLPDDSNSSRSWNSFMKWAVLISVVVIAFTCLAGMLVGTKMLKDIKYATEAQVMESHAQDSIDTTETETPSTRELGVNSNSDNTARKKIMVSDSLKK